MRTKPLVAWTTWLLVIFAVLWLSGCSSSTPSTTAGQESTTATTTQPAQEPATTVESAPAETSATQTASSPGEPASPTVPEVSETSPETVPGEAAEQPVLTWDRTAGPFSYCDRMSIYTDGRVEAVACQTGTTQPTVNGDLTGEQLSQLSAWASEYASFTRREQEMSGAVRTTTFNGTGSSVPALEVKTAIAAFASDVFFSLTGTH
jgi:hypothetical protein